VGDGLRLLKETLQNTVELIGFAVETGLLDTSGNPTRHAPDCIIGSGVKRWEHGHRIPMKDLFAAVHRGRIPSLACQGTTGIYRAPIVNEQGARNACPGVFLIG
jgi:hypothetical protein